MSKRAFFILFVILLVLLGGCKEPEEWYDVAVVSFSNSIFLTLQKDPYLFKRHTVYTGDDAKIILNLIGWNIDGGINYEKKTKQEVNDILNDRGLPADLAERAHGSITAYFYTKDDRTGPHIAAFVEDTSGVHGRNIERSVRR